MARPHRHARVGPTAGLPPICRRDPEQSAVVRAGGEPHHGLSPNGFSYQLRLSPPSPRSPGGRRLWSELSLHLGPRAVGAARPDPRARWCPLPDLNWDGPCGPWDFKSHASTIPPRGPAERRPTLAPAPAARQTAFHPPATSSAGVPPRDSISSAISRTTTSSRALSVPRATRLTPNPPTRK